MKIARSTVVVLVTAPNRKSARQIARAALQANFAACANIIPGLESHYWWQGKKQKSRETLLVIKSKTSLFTRLEKMIRENHSYTTPEIIALPLVKGSRSYLTWLRRETC